MSSIDESMDQEGFLAIQRLSHNSKSQQKEARTGRYIEKQASDFAKYLIMGQTLHHGEAANAMQVGKYV